jgi:hypothetical protein
MSHDSIEKGLKALQTRLDTGIFRSPREQALDSSLDTLQGILDSILAQLDPSTLVVESVSDLYKVSIAVTGLKRAHLESEKFRLDAEDRHEKAYLEFKDQLRLDLCEHPELQAQLRQIAENAAKKVADKPRAGRPRKHSKKEQ